MQHCACSDATQLGSCACRKILKKHDKMTTTTLMGTLMPRVAEMLSKEQRKAALEGLKNNVVHEYGLLAVEGNEEQAEQDLSRYQRDQLTFERNTGQFYRYQQSAQQARQVFPQTLTQAECVSRASEEQYKHAESYECWHCATKALLHGLNHSTGGKTPSCC